MAEQITEIQFGPITLFDALEPELPDMLTQASIVANYYEQAYREKLRGQRVNLQQIGTYTRLAQGDLSAMYRQRTKEEVDLERRNLTVELNGQTYLYYDESVMQMSILPVDQQLLHDFYKARVASWIDKNSKTIFWLSWNKARKKSKVEQTETLKILTKQSPGSTSGEIAYSLARAAIDIPTHNGTDKQALVNIILKDMFISERIIYPPHLAFPVQITYRVPSWVWKDGLKYLIPAWWLIEKQGDLEEHSENHIERSNATSTYPTHFRRMMSAAPYLVIDRASRDGRNWLYNPAEEVFPYFEDGRTAGIRLTYGTPEAPNFDIQVAAQLAVEQVNRLDDRTADVWRVILWKATENGISSAGVYARIIIDTREIAQLLGYKKHHKGGMKPEHLLEVHNALQHLECMRIYLTPEARG